MTFLEALKQKENAMTFFSISSHTPVLILLCSLFCSAATAQWTQLPGPLTGTIVNHPFEFAGKVFVSGTSTTAYTSDGGKTWNDVIVNGQPISFIKFMGTDGKKLIGFARKD